jgi:hypothetical protein
VSMPATHLTSQSETGNATGGCGVLERNRRDYEELRRLLLESAALSPRTLACCAGQVADFAQFNHPGRFADGRVENCLIEAGCEAREDVRSEWFRPPRLAREAKRHVLHVATQVLAIGGHTRTIRNWVTNDPDSVHSLLVTSQGRRRVPEWLVDAVRGSSGEVIILPSEAPLMDRARWTRQVAASSIDFVVLHHFGHDVTPVLAYACGDGPPVGLLNHADHLFWLGGSVSDVIINLRQIGRVLAEQRRFARRNVVLPIPLTDFSASLSREQSRRQLGIPADQVMLLSVGRPQKYVPTPTHNFFRTASRILDENRGAHMYVVGVSQANAAALGEEPHERLHLVGPCDNAGAYQLAADVYLEGFPFGSQTAFLESAMAGVPGVPAFDPPCALLVTNDEALTGLADNPATEDEYVERATTLVRDEGWRRARGKMFRQQVLSCHVGEEWHRRLDDLYRQTAAIAHGPGPIPEGPFVASETDVALSEWQEAHARRDGCRGTGSPLPRLRQQVVDAAYAARQFGDYAGSLLVLRRAGQALGYDWPTASAIVKLAPHFVRHVGRRVWARPEEACRS